MIDWRAIVAEHGGTVWQTAYRLLSNHADAADCFQETFVSAIKLARREKVKNWGPLLRRLATARALDRLRQRLRRTQRSGDAADWAQVASASPSPVEAAEVVELRARLRRAVAELPEQQAQVFCLRYLEDMSYRQIARELALTSNAVGVVLHRARSALRGLLAPGEGQRKR
jgi:RNA polymerase sigma-70 factor (ECF subfamily)